MIHSVCDGVRGVMRGGHHRARIVAVPARQSSALIAISRYRLSTIRESPFKERDVQPDL